MIKNILFLISAIEAVVGGPTGSQCCASKTVGDISYTLVETEYAVPGECLNSCTYTRDDQAESLFCFAKGELPVHCTAENPVSICYQGCGPDYDTKIVDSTPLNISTRPTLYDCWDYCRASCNDFWCPCHAWSYDENSTTCYTYPGPFHCHQTKHEPGWVSGGLCFGNNTRPILEADDVPGEPIPDSGNKMAQFTIGNINGAKIPFNTKKISVGGGITKVTMYKGTYFKFDGVIVGIQITFGTTTSAVFGKITKEKFTCEFQPNGGNPIVDIYGRAQHPNNPANNAVIFSLGFNRDTENPRCEFGNTVGGTRFNQDVADLKYVSGFTTETIPVLGQLTFHYET